MTPAALCTSQWALWSGWCERLAEGRQRMIEQNGRRPARANSCVH